MNTVYTYANETLEKPVFIDIHPSLNVIVIKFGSFKFNISGTQCTDVNGHGYLNGLKI